MTGERVFRFAPSPNGPLHLGHVFSALLNFEMAANTGGRLLLRIEDIDTGRAREDFIVAIYADLRWLGLRWETPVLRQSQHFDRYLAAAGRLKELGLLYPCFATRTQIAAAARAGGSGTDPDGAPIYPGLHRDLTGREIAERKAAGEAYALRIDMARALDVMRQKLGTTTLQFVEADRDGNEREIEVRPERWGDAVIVRKDSPTSYHLAVVVDDAFQGVTHVVRGQDLFAATDIQRLLQVLLDLPAPKYHHHHLLLDEDGRKLAKSNGAQSLAQLRQEGFSAAEVRAMAAGEPAKI